MSAVSDRSASSTVTTRNTAILAGAKRKRDHASEATAKKTGSSHQGDRRLEHIHQLFRDSVTLLRSHDVTPSILDHPIPLSQAKSPVGKKSKLAVPAEILSIARRVQSNDYNSIDDISRDLDSVVGAVIEEIKSAPNGNTPSDDLMINHGSHKEIAHAITFKQEFSNIILRELMQRTHLMDSADPKDRPSSLSDGKFISDSDEGIEGRERNNSVVLTLFGGSNQPKQLFSSPKESHQNQRYEASRSKSRPSDFGLPNGINFTQVVPVHSQGSQDKKEVPNLGKRFAPPPGLQSLNPPRQSRHTATRSSSVNWYNPSEATAPSRPNRRDSYSTQPLTTSQWLTYNVAPSTRDLASPDSKRKQRDRALSFGEPQGDVSEQTLAVHRQAKEEALFRSVYSGFAPDRDNAGALVSQQGKNRLWWKRMGERRFQQSTVGSQQRPDYNSEGAAVSDDEEPHEQPEDPSFAEAVESWTPEEPPAEMLVGKDSTAMANANGKEVDDILQDISELLETLNSYQDVRNLSLANNARTSASQNSQLSAMTGTPASPSSDEFDLYNMLKSQLSIMVSSLPPYALAKLDGQKLGLLNINTKIQVETKNYQGSLEEDEISTRGRQPIASAASAYPSRSGSTTAGIAPRNSYLAAASTPAATLHRASYMPQTVPARTSGTSSYLSNQQYLNRTTPIANPYLTNNSRSSYTTQQRPVSSSTPDRYPYATSQQYNAQSGRQSYTNGYSQYPGQNGSTYGQGYSHSPANARLPQAPYQQSSRPPQSYSYATAPISGAGSASPSKAVAQYAAQVYGNQTSTSSQARGSFSHPSAVQPVRQASSSSPQINGANSSHGQPAAGGAVTEMQAAKAQLADGRGSHTPQPVTAGQVESGQLNGSSIALQNGNTAASDG
ncbi:MAG: hypothetical protein Q9220_006382 [cf. Caloplaca sp. 1 TL-2023]